MQQRSPEWFEARKNRITASMVGAILGVAPYMTRADAMRAMVRESLGAEREFQGNIATEYGTNNEAGALIDYRIETGREVEEVGFIQHEDWAGCSPDGLIGDLGGVEVKCPYGLRKAEKPVPFKTLAEQPHYEAQVQLSLFITARSFWDFFQWSPSGTAHETALPDKEWQDKNLPILRQFYAEFLDELKSPDDHLAPKRATIDTPEAHKMVAELDQLNEALENAADRKKDLIAEMADMAGGKNAIFAGRKLTQVERAGSVSWAKVAKKYCPKADTKPFTGKPSKYWQVK